VAKARRGQASLLIALLAAMCFAIHLRSISGTALDDLSNRRADVAT
jgi:hypothetical protein